jgi:hypothetical protein
MSWKITPKGAVLKLGSTSKLEEKLEEVRDNTLIRY